VGRRGVFGGVGASVLLLLVFAPAASAFKVITQSGSGAGQTAQPRGLAVDTETGRLFVADEGNNRVDVFDTEGNFLKAFGWGVKDGSPVLQTCTSACLKGSAGTGAGQFSKPTAIAVDNSPTSTSRHAVYVVDFGNLRVEKFDEEGNFLLSFGSEGTGEGQFASPGGLGSGVFVGVGPTGTVYVVDSLRPGSEFERRLQRFKPDGTPIPTQCILGKGGRASALAVDSSGSFYVSNQGTGVAIRKYDTACKQIAEIAGGGFPALAADLADDHLFAAEQSKEYIAEYNPAGTQLRAFGYGTSGISGLAPHESAGGDIYASAAKETIHNAKEGVIQLDIPPPGPLVFPEPCKASPVGNTKATLHARVNPEGKATSFHFEYISDAKFKEDGNSFGAGTEKTSESASIGNDFELHSVSAVAGGEAELTPETQYHCRAVAKNADGEASGPEGEFTTEPPFKFLGIWATEVKGESATLNAELNPLGIATTGVFEYVDDASFQASGFTDAEESPVVSFGAGETPASASAEISGLIAGTLYHYRILVKDKFFAAGIPCRGQEPICPGEPPTFRALPPVERPPPDGRRYELVSPGQKNSAEVGAPIVAGGLFSEKNPRIQAAAGSGEAITYTSWTSFGDPKGAPGASQYLSKRGPDGWGTENISPFGFQRNALRPAYRGFSADLTFAGLVMDEPACGEGAAAGVESLCLRENATGAEQALTIEAPVVDPGEAAFCTGYAGASADGKHAFFAANGAMAGAPAGKGFSLYEWSEGEPLELISVLPDGSPAAPSPKSAFGAAAPSASACAVAQSIVRHAVSEDGSVLFWTYGGKYIESESPLLARIDGAETIQLDAKAAGEKAGGKGIFWGASADGSKALFSAPGELTPDAKAEGQLYRYDTEARTSTDLTPGSVEPKVKGVIGFDEAMTHVYFVAGGVLTGAEENDAGQKAGAGANNLYLYHEEAGKGVLRFIGVLSNLDEGAWDSAPSGLNARVSADGRALAFTSIETMKLLKSGYENKIAVGTACEPADENRLVGDPHCPEAFLYDADADVLSCVSCNPSGARPAGPAELPSWSNPFEGPRYLSDQGTRLFFESRDTLTSADENTRRDVYELERTGTGSCSVESSAFEPGAGGCLFLISRGTDTDESYLLDASGDGRDVFFATRAVLSGWDTNENYDVYDARIGGGFPEPTSVPICEGEASCRPTPTSPPAAATPATPGFSGPGNAKAKKKKAKRGKKHHHRPRHHHHKRGARR
jgi:hypothetical protein